MAEAKTVGSLHSDSTEVGFNSALGACQVAHLWEEALGSSAGTEEAMNRRMRRFLKGSWKPTVRGYFKLFPLIFRSICGLVEGQFHWKSFFAKKKTSWISCRFSRGQQVSYLEDFGNIT
jgi:hypothetical protein